MELKEQIIEYFKNNNLKYSFSFDREDYFYVEFEYKKQELLCDFEIYDDKSMNGSFSIIKNDEISEIYNQDYIDIKDLDDFTANLEQMMSFVDDYIKIYPKMEKKMKEIEDMCDILEIDFENFLKEYID